MIIDIIPQVRKANAVEKISMNIYNETERFVFMRGDVGFSVQFNKKTLEQFCKQYTVSEMISSWYQGLIDDYEMFQKAVDTKIHPTWTRTIKNPDCKSIWDKNEIVVGYQLSKTELVEFIGYAERAKKRIQPITFWRIEI
jgi:hypothetical protein